MIRKGELKDVPYIIVMAKEFWKNTKYKNAKYDPEMVEAMAEHCINQGMMAVLISKGQIHGFCCGIKGPLLASGDFFIGTEVAWWVDEEHRSGRNGIGLLKKMEKLAKEAGCKYWNMIFMQSSMPDTIEHIYKKMGYDKSETAYSKELL